jgi:hypothetical protein
MEMEDKEKRKKSKLLDDIIQLTFSSAIVISIKLPSTMMKSKLFHGSPK